ncbi:MAG: hypothetical protein RLZZ275_904 [Bacteroidota bacterium]
MHKQFFDLTGKGNHGMLGAVVSVPLLAGCDITYRGCTDSQAVKCDTIALTL